MAKSKPAVPVVVVTEPPTAAERPDAAPPFPSVNELLNSPRRLTVADVAQIRARSDEKRRDIQERMIERRFVLDSSLGEVEVIVRSPAKAVKLNATDTTLTIVTDTAEDHVTLVGSARRDVGNPARHLDRGAWDGNGAPRRVRPAGRQLSGDPTEPGGTIEESLPGDDSVAEMKGRELESEVLSNFLRDGQRALMARGNQE